MVVPAGSSGGWASILTATAAAHGMARGVFSATEYVRDVIESIDRDQERYGAFVETYPSEALQRARMFDQWRGHRPSGPLDGVVFAVKDSVAVAGTALTAGSRSTRADAIPGADADVVAKLRAAGAILIGKVGLEEFGIGPTTEDSPQPVPKNPWDQTRSTGGSSSGSAVATAAGLVPFAIGTDSAGSIRLPAAHCGVVGFKPTFGLVDTRGVVPLSHSLDHLGITTRDVMDVDLVLRSLLGAGGTDGLAPRSLAGARIGILDADLDAVPGIDSELYQAFLRAVAAMEARGAICERVVLAPLETYQQCGATILHGEAYREYRKRLRDHGADMHAVTLRRLSSGAHISDTELAAALDRGRQLRAEFDATVAPFDALVSMTTFAPPGPAIDIDVPNDRSLRLSPRMPFNVVGAPAIAVPIGFTSDGMPISIQFVGARHRDRQLLRVAAAFQREVGVDDLAISHEAPQLGDKVGSCNRRPSSGGVNFEK